MESGTLRSRVALLIALVAASAACLLPGLDTLSAGDASVAADGSVATDGGSTDGATILDGSSDVLSATVLLCPRTSVRCTAQSEMCCPTSSSWECVPASKPQCADDAGEFRCDTNLQCAAGSVCCIVTAGITNLSRPSTKCVAAGTCKDSRQLCHSSAECDGGKQCTPEPMIGWPLACR